MINVRNLLNNLEVKLKEAKIIKKEELVLVTMVRPCCGSKKNLSYPSTLKTTTEFCENCKEKYSVSL